MAKSPKIILVALCVLTQLQTPVPSKREAGQRRENQTGGTQQPPSRDQRGTEEVPFVVKTLPTPKTDTETTQDAQERKEKSANDSNLVKFTLYLVVATGVLAVIGALQLFVFGYQAIQLQRTVQAAKESSDALINTERPWVLIAAVGSEQKFRNNQMAQEAYFTIRNYGKSPAWIIEMGGTFETLKNLSELPPNPVYEHIENETNRGIVIVPRTVEDDKYSLWLPHKNAFVNAEFQRVANTKELLWCVYGFVIYKDIFGKVRETRFCSVLDEWPRFKFEDVPSYNKHT